MKNRFLLLARTDYRKNRKKITILFLALFTIFFVTYWNSGPLSMGGNVLVASLNCFYVIIAMVYVLLSFSFVNYYGKERMMNAMLPVGKGEKFTYLFIRNMILFPLAVFLVYYLNHSLWEIIFGKCFHLGIEHSVYYKLNMITNGFMFFLAAVLFKRCQVVYALMLILLVGRILLPVNGIGQVYVSFTPGMLPYAYSNFRFFEVAVVLFNAVILYGAWVKFKNLQIK